eukprot:UN13302
MPHFAKVGLKCYPRRYECFCTLFLICKSGIRCGIDFKKISKKFR